MWRRRDKFHWTLHLLAISSAEKRCVFLLLFQEKKTDLLCINITVYTIVFSKALEQDIASRQSSISAMKAKVKKFVETADPSAAALLQSKMEALSQRFSDACDKHQRKVSQLEGLREKVEQFESIADKVQQFVVRSTQELNETDSSLKTFDEMSQQMQVR